MTDNNAPANGVAIRCGWLLVDYLKSNGTSESVCCDG